MRNKCALAFIVGILLLAGCVSRRTLIQTVEVTRLVPQLFTISVPKVVRETQIVTVMATRPPRPTQIVTVLVTQVVKETLVIKETQVVTQEVTRLVPQTEAVLPTPPLLDLVSVDRKLSLLFARTQHTATTLQDGRVIVVGGSQAPNVDLAEVEIFSPVDDTITQAMPMYTLRHGHSATLLFNQRVLVVGGYNHAQQWLNDAEVYDAQSDEWIVVPPLFPHGVGHSATRLSDGRVLVVGGCIGDGVCTERVEIFDPLTNSWSEAASLDSDRASHTAVRLDDGRVLVVGGGSAEGAPAGGDATIYDPDTNTWTATSPMFWPRIFAASVRLRDGRVLVAGGIELKETLAPGPSWRMSTHVEIYDPSMNSWTPAADLWQGRYAHTMTLLDDGRVLVAGGARDWDCCWDSDSFVRGIEIYDPTMNVWYSVNQDILPGAFPATVRMHNGRVWITGGQAGQSSEDFRSETWLITVK